MKKRVFRDWEEACENTRFNRAVGKLGKIRHNGQEVEVDVLKEPGKNGYVVYAGTGLVIRTATTAEVDSIVKWRPW